MISTTKFNELITTYKEDINRLSRELSRKFHISFKDAKHTAYISVWTYGDLWDFNKKASFRGYIRRSTIWSLIKESKKDDRMIYDIDYLTNKEFDGGVRDANKGVNISQVDLEDSIDKLPKRYRNVLFKYFVEGKKLAEIAKETKQSIEMVRLDKNHALELFKERLKND